MPIIKGEEVKERGNGLIYGGGDPSHPFISVGYRYGNWKYVLNSHSCLKDDCKKHLLYDLSTDLGE